MRQYASAPDVVVYGDPQFTFPYVPSHLHHMVFELVKNSLRAVNDRFEDSIEEVPPVRLVVAEGGEDVTIKVTSVSLLCPADSERVYCKDCSVFDHASLLVANWPHGRCLAFWKA